MKTLQSAVGCNGVLYEVVQETNHEFYVIDRATGGSDYYPFALYADARSVEFFLTMKVAREVAQRMNLEADSTAENLKWKAGL